MRMIYGVPFAGLVRFGSSGGMLFYHLSFGRTLTLTLLVTVVGTLKGYDQLMNLVLDDVKELLRGTSVLHYFPPPPFTGGVYTPALRDRTEHSLIQPFG